MRDSGLQTSRSESTFIATLPTQGLPWVVNMLNLLPSPALDAQALSGCLPGFLTDFGVLYRHPLVCCLGQ